MKITNLSLTFASLIIICSLISDSKCRIQHFNKKEKNRRKSLILKREIQKLKANRSQSYNRQNAHKVLQSNFNNQNMNRIQMNNNFQNLQAMKPVVRYPQQNMIYGVRPGNQFNCKLILSYIILIIFLHLQ